MNIYIGESENTYKRVYQHFSASIEASVLRKDIAESRHYQINRVIREAGNVKVTLANLAHERNITEYLEGGKWKFVICVNRAEAQDFKYFAISRLNPILNPARNGYLPANIDRCEQLLAELINCQEHTLNRRTLHAIPKLVGVHLFISDQNPGQI